MSKFIIFGTSNFSQMMRFYVEKYTDKKVYSYCVEKAYLTDEEFDGLPLCAFEDLAGDEYEILITAGYKEMNDIRKRIFNESINKKIKIANFIHPTANLNTNNIGIGNIFLENVYIGYNSKIGDGNIFWNGCNISHDNEIGNFNYFSPSSVSGGNVIIKDNSFMGLNCTLRSGITVEEKTVVGAGVYMYKSSEPLGVYTPSRCLKLEKNSMQVF